MNCPIFAAVSADCSVSQAPKDPTLGEHLDDRIVRARAHLEKLCVMKAKAEATQMLNTPMSFVYDVAY